MAQNGAGLRLWIAGIIGILLITAGINGNFGSLLAAIVDTQDLVASPPTVGGGAGGTFGGGTVIQG